MRRAPWAAMLTLLATLAATLAVAGCGGKTSSTPTTGTATHKPAAKAPGY